MAIKMIQTVADMHCHTIASTHAYSTVKEMITAAARKGLYAIALTEHGRAMPGAPGTFYFENLKRNIPSMYEGVRVITGIEANIIDYEGNIDASDELLDRLEWVIASIHKYTINGESTVEGCTNAWLKIAENPRIDVIGHCGTAGYEFDYDKVIKVFAEKGKLVEINSGSFRFRPKSIPNCRKIAELCKKHGARIIINSDAHFEDAVGVHDSAIKMLEEINFPKELIVNADIDTFKKLLTEKNISLD